MTPEERQKQLEAALEALKSVVIRTLAFLEAQQGRDEVNRSHRELRGLRAEAEKIRVGG
jgi:hypothetical protein